MIAIYIDYKLERFTKEIKYSFRYIFENRGFAYRFVKSEAELKTNDIFIIYSLSEPSEEHLKAIAKHFVTIFILCEPELYEKGAYNPEKLRRNLREAKLLYPCQVISRRPFQHVAENYIDSDASGGKINIDIVGNIFFHLSMQEYGFFPATTGADHFTDENSAFFPYKETPVVDSLMWLLESMIKEHVRAQKIPLAQKAFWPQAETSAVLLSHTVDKLQKWDMISLALSVVDDITLLFTLKFQQFFHTLWGKLQYLFTNYELYWNFEDYRRLERDNACRSTFYMAVDKNTEIDYSLDDGDLQEEIQETLKNGSEIGLLLSNEKLNRDEMIKQRQIMLHQLVEDSVGIKQYGNTVNLEILELHQKLSPSFSQSTAFRDGPGFYSGISFPYHPYLAGKAPFIMLPTTYQDSYLRVNKYKILSLDDAKAQIKRFFQITQRTQGIFALDLSLAGYHDIHYMPKLYAYVLELFGSADAWLATASELVDWWEKRSRITIEEGEYEISLYFPDDLPAFTLKIHGEQKVREIDGLKAKIDGNSLFFTDIKAESFAVLHLVK